MEIPNFNKQEDELETGMDKWMFILRNLSQLDKIPVILDKRIFSKLSKLAEVAKLTKEEHKMYEESLMQKWDYKNGIDYAVETAVKEAEEKAAEREWLAVERQRLAIATNFIKKGYNQEDIQDATSLSIDRLKELEKQINSGKN